MLKMVLKWVKENYKEYLLIGLLFIIGIFTGVLIVNNCDENQKQEIGKYIENFVTKFKSTDDINIAALIAKSIKNNLLLAISLWLAGTTVIGLPVVFGVILYKGIRLGFTIAFISYTFGKFGGIMLCIISMTLQNVFFIPGIITIGVSSVKLCKSILKDRDRQNVKKEILRHTIISIFMIILIILAAVIENSISISILKNSIKYF